MSFSVKTVIPASGTPIDQLHVIPGEPRRLLSVSGAVMHLWNLQTQQCIGRAEKISSSLSIFDKQIAVHTHHAVRLYDTRTLKRTYTRKSHKITEDAVLMGHFLLTPRDPETAVYSLKSNQPMPSILTRFNTHVKLSERFLFAQSNGHSSIIDAYERNPIRLGTLSYSPTCGTAIKNRFVFNNNSVVHVYTPADREYRSISFSDSIVAFAGRPDRAGLFAGFVHGISYWPNLPMPTVYKVRTTQNQAIQSLAAFSAQRVAIGFDDGSISLCTFSTHQGSTNSDDSNSE